MRATSRLAILALVGAFACYAQADWRAIGASAAESRLAGPVTGPMVRVWFAPDGSTLYARTASGNIFQTIDFETWDSAAPDAPAEPATFRRDPVRKPDPGAQYFAVSDTSQEVWGVGQQLYHSEDGKSWESLTSYKLGSVIGSGLHSVAVSPNDPGQLVVANDFGVWRSLDGGLTWGSLNLKLPNLSVERILATPSGGHVAQVYANLGGLELMPGSTTWRSAPALSAQPDIWNTKKRTYSSQLRADVSAYVESSDGRQVYAGSKDGRIWRSQDGGATFFMSTPLLAVPGHQVERMYLDPVNPNVVLAALSGPAPHVLRTFNGGLNWEGLDNTGDNALPNVSAYGIAADAASGAIYVATEQGVYWTQFRFDVGAQSDNLTWKNLTAKLPRAKATDVALDPAAVQLYVALDGYGVYATAAPHRPSGVRFVNAADYSSRAAAPGSLISILGERVTAVTGGSRAFPVWNNSQIPSANSQIQVPFETVGPTVSLALDTAAGRLTRDLAVLPVSPTIFVGQDGVPWILDADSGMPLDRNVAHPGQRLQVLATGLGRVRPDWQTGVEAPKDNTPTVVATVSASLDRSPVPVGRATLAPGYVGMYLVEVQLPLVTNYGAMELKIAADGHESNTVQIVVGQ